MSGEAIVGISAGGKILSTGTLFVNEHPLTVVTVNTYSPLFATVMLGITGFSKSEVNPFGPLHA